MVEDTHTHQEEEEEEEEDMYEVKRTGPPHPKWKPGEKQRIPFESGLAGMKAYAPEELTSCYSLCISAVVPRPIAFVSTKCPTSGVVNLAPYSYSGVVAHDPPTVVFSACMKPGAVKKDTLVNVEASGEFVLSFMSEWFVEAANHCCGNFPPDVDEFGESGLTPVPSTLVKPPRVAESALQMECKVTHTHEIRNAEGKLTATTVFGEVLMFHIHDDIHTMKEGRVVVDVEKYKPISRLGGNIYGTCVRDEIHTHTHTHTHIGGHEYVSIPPSVSPSVVLQCRDIAVFVRERAHTRMPRLHSVSASFCASESGGVHHRKPISYSKPLMW